MNTVRWYYRIFQGAPDLFRELLPGSAAAANALGLGPAAAAGAAGSPRGLADRVRVAGVIDLALRHPRRSLLLKHRVVQIGSRT